MKYKLNGEWIDVNIKALDSMVIGSIIQFMGTTIPAGWLECNGGTITQSEYPELYNLIGGTLPDFRGRVLVGQDTTQSEFDTLGETGGSKYLQEHTHVKNTPFYAYEFSQGIDGQVYKGGNAREYKDIYTGNVSGVQTGNSGNLQPYAVVKHIIKALNTTPTMASVVNIQSDSTEDTYSCDYINGKILWTNSSPNSVFAPQNITLNSSDYNYLEIYFKSFTDQNNIKSIKVEKGQNALLDCSFFFNNSIYIGTRVIEYTNDTTLYANAGRKIIQNAQIVNGEDNGWVIPTKIIGYK
jgi:hypothetical protein